MSEKPENKVVPDLDMQKIMEMESPMFPVVCPNKCDPKKTMPIKDVEAHRKNDCPLEPVNCELCWAGCTAIPQRKDIEQHITSNQVQHFKLLAKACGELSVRCFKLESDIAAMKRANRN